MTSYRLKCIAIVTMTIDHFAKIFTQAFLLRIFPEHLMATYYAINVLEWIGRLTFPIFAYLIVEGCLKTRSIPRYLGRLALFALISEPFYVFAFNMSSPFNETASMFLRQLSSFRITNVFATLALGVLAIYVIQLAVDSSSKFPKWLMPPVLIFICIYSLYAKTDYTIFGVLLIVTLFLCKSRRAKAVTIVLWSVLLYMGYASWYDPSVWFSWLRGGSAWAWINPVITTLCSSAAAFLTYHYNGERGKPIKWAFYIYYPAHLLILFAINLLV